MAVTVMEQINYSAEVTTLEQAYSALPGDRPKDIPFLVWLIENPDSFLALPGNIFLREHDYIHILLGRGQSPEDEAFVIGFTMGSDSKTNRFHLTVFMLIATRFYPQPYRFTLANLVNFDLGFELGRQSKFKLGEFNLELYKSRTVAAIRRRFNLSVSGYY